MPRILHAIDPAPSAWAASLGRAATLGFDTLLLPAGPLPAALIEAAGGLNIALLSDIRIDQAEANDRPGQAGPFRTIPAPSTDPRRPPTPAPIATAALAAPGDALALADFWGPRITASTPAGVRLLGLQELPGWAVPLFLARLRMLCPDTTLFAWTPGLPPSVLKSIPAHAVDYVAVSLAAWDGHADWLWRDLALLRAIAPVVSEAVSEPGGAAVDAAAQGRHTALAAFLSEGWMTVEHPEVEALNKARQGIGGLPWSTLVSSSGDDAYAILRTDAPDPRQAHRAALAFTASAPASMDPAGPLSALQGNFGAFRTASGDRLVTGHALALDAGGLRLYTAEALPVGAAAPLGRKRAEAAAATSRIAIEAPSPCVEGGRFPARQVVGSEVVVEADLIADGHDQLAAVVRWRMLGEDEWSEQRMRLINNDRWTATFPLHRLGRYEFAVEAWKDAYATYVDELEKKFNAGVPIALELQEGANLVRAAAGRARKSVAAALAPVLKILEADGPDAVRTILLDPETQAAMARADDRPHRVSTAPIPVQAERTGAGFASWYEVFPRSLSDDPARHGTFRDVVGHLPRVAAMGFDVLYFPPFHPIGRVNRKGRNNTLTPADDDPGSPYAIGSTEGGHDALHPELGSIEDFQHLRMEAARHGIELAMDFAIQCAPDHPWLKQHKDWFDWRPDGSIKYAENPPKKYQDIVNVDFYASGAIPDLWLALANAVLYWASQGIRLFRVDNPHTKPLPFWEWMIAEVQARYPDAVFLAEAFTRPKVMYRLAKSGFGQSYTYFTWRNTKPEFQAYLTELTDPRPGSPREYFRPHFFVNTPDINPVPLQAAPRQAFLIRVALASTLSGLWGLYNGFELCEASPVPGREEYLDSEKYQLRAWDWDRPGNIVAEIAVLNAIRKRNAALQTHLNITFLNADNDQVLLFEKATPDRSNVVLVAINLDLYNPQSSRIDVPFWRFASPARPGVAAHPEPDTLTVTDLLTDRQERWTDRNRLVSLTAAQPYAIWRLRDETAGRVRPEEGQA